MSRPALRPSLVGCSGVGKTALASRVARAWGLPRLELDALYHHRTRRCAPTRAGPTSSTTALRDRREVERWCRATAARLGVPAD